MAKTHPRHRRQRRRRRPSDRTTVLVLVLTLLSVVVPGCSLVSTAAGMARPYHRPATTAASTPTTKQSPPSKIFSAGGGLKQDRIVPRRAASSSLSLSALTVRGGSATIGRSSRVAAAAAAAAMMAAVGHIVPVSLVAAFLPTCLGFWRTGYTVSYGYGGAMVLSGLTQLVRLVEHPRSHSAVLSSSSSSVAGVPLVAAVHAALYVCYGLRLCLFLLQRELQTPVEIHGMIRRQDPITVRLTKRFPIIVGSSVLYWFMSTAPMHVIYHTTTQTLVSATTHTNFLEYLFLGVGFSGFLFAAIGDAWKAVMKSRNGKDFLVTTGPFRYFRHPNYTGEMLGWTCLCLLLPVLTTLQAAVATASWTSMVSSVGPYLLASMLGWAGMVLGVLMVEATAGLEQKQHDKYGTTQDYQHWVAQSWSGPMFPKKKKTSVTTTKEETKEL